ncbi:hypothetical protein [Pandoraea soli]|uniref:Uncharacterized protein n=1 Tax=Pandoraea soli TaxID=2508293 RepID=A0ABY6VTP8_9BURK|nr:hypothetical protein [Pandoraea soli]VVD87554.1 hypothetical protein PSO31014_01435 [Pandoraea soli]
MPFASHHRAIHVAPCYGLPPARPQRENGPGAAVGLSRAFHGARSGRPETGLPVTGHPGRPRTGQPTHSAAWPAALAILLVANLAAPASGAVPRRARPAEGSGETGADIDSSFDPEALPSANATAWTALDDVVIQPVERPLIKSDYTFHDFLKAVAAARAPFRHFGESAGDAYEILSGEDVDPQVRRNVRHGAEVLDLATGLLPGVPMLRLPGELADIADDALERKAPDAEKIAGFLQYGDPRVTGSAPQRLGGSSSPERSPSASQLASKSLKPRDVDLMPIDLMRNSHAADGAHAVAPDEMSDVHGEDSNVGADGTGEAGRFSFAPRVNEGGDVAVPGQTKIFGEDDHLQGYAQPLPADQIPTGEQARVVLVKGQHYLRGEAGYYRARRGLSDDHWLIDAPQGAERRAQVPVTYDVGTGEWRAHAPLRLCGGGCGSSRFAYPPDSIATSFDDISRAIRHVPDESSQEAIQLAFAELSELHLLRTNRADLQPIRDNSIINHRTALRNSMSKEIDPTLPLPKQQRIAADITSTHYEWNSAAEAFCQENAEILFHRLLTNGVPKDDIRMITFKPQNRPPHVMVIYTESEHFIQLMDRSTPNQPDPRFRDGISQEFFREAAYLTRHSTLLLDPWSTTKAISFAGATSRYDAGRLINRALIDIGHMPGNPYTVSLTRPLGIHRPTLKGSVELASSGTSSGQSASASASQDSSWTSLETALSQDTAPASSN